MGGTVGEKKDTQDEYWMLLLSMLQNAHLKNIFLGLQAASRSNDLL